MNERGIADLNRRWLDAFYFDHSRMRFMLSQLFPSNSKPIFYTIMPYGLMFSGQGAQAVKGHSLYKSLRSLANFTMRLTTSVSTSRKRLSTDL